MSLKTAEMVAWGLFIFVALAWLVLMITVG